MQSVLWGVAAALNGTCTAPVFAELPGGAALRARPAVRQRPSIPACNQSYVPLALSGPRGGFPKVYDYRGSADFASALVGLLEAELPRSGALLVRGAPIDSTAAFSALLHATGMPLRDYIGGVTSRPVEAPKVTPASTEPAAVDMELHSDGTYRPRPPERLLLWCKTPPAAGGQALLADARAVLRRLRQNAPEHVAELERRRVRYYHFLPHRNFSGGGTIASWQDVFAPGCEAPDCDARALAERTLASSGYAFNWSAAGLEKWVSTSPVLRHRITGEETWANQVAAMHCTVFANHPTYPELHTDDTFDAPCVEAAHRPYHTTFGDGGEFPRALLHAVREAQWASAVSFDFAAGDLLVIDNYLAMHGRFSFTSPRELFIAVVGGGV